MFFSILFQKQLFIIQQIEKDKQELRQNDVYFIAFDVIGDLSQGPDMVGIYRQEDFDRHEKKLYSKL